MRVAVVGAGVAGASSAWALARRGHEVVVFEQFEGGHDRGSSHGNSRIVRKAYPDAFYTELMLEGYPMWGELEALSSEPVLHEVGLLYFGSAGSEEIQSVAGALEDLGVEHEVLNPSEARGRMPQLALGPNEVGVFTPEAGWVHAERAVSLLIDLAEGLGAQVRRVRVDSLERLEAEFDGVALCAGAWNTKFLDLPVEVTLQTFAYLEADGPGPVWIEESPLYPYGFPSEPGLRSIKIGVHSKGTAIDPDDPNREPGAVAIERIRETAAKRFGIESPRVLQAKGCLYTRKEDEDFLLGRVGEKTVFASACSGHGFKFGPWVGTALADFLDGRRSPEQYPRLAFEAKRKN